jgi:hypothetical protein
MADIFAPEGGIWIQVDLVLEGAAIDKQARLSLGVTVALRSGF